MPLFTVSCRDRSGAHALRADTRERHLAFLADAGAAVRLGGPWLDADGRAVGSLLIVEADDLETVRRMAERDPYAQAGLFASVSIEPWRLVVGGFS